MTPAIRQLLETAALEYEAEGLVYADTQMTLAAEGYDLSCLERDIEKIIQETPVAEVIPFPNADEVVG